MSNLLMLQDAIIATHLFRWTGAIPDVVLREFLQSQGLLDRCPRELVALWRETGGGEFLESEEVLEPFGDPEMGDSFAAANREWHQRGLPDHFYVFHQGSAMSAFDTHMLDFLELDPSTFSVRRRFMSLDDWYRAVVRDELGTRYGLPPVA